MGGTFEKLKKLRGRGREELSERGAQALAALAERRGLSRAGRLPDDRSLFKSLDPAGFARAPRTAQDLLESFRARTPHPFFAAFADAAATRRALTDRFGREHPSELLRRAQGAAAGRFDLLGLKGLDFGSPVDWHLEPVSKKRAPLKHWSEIDYLDPSVAGDKKITWELNRHQHFLALGRAYWRTRDESFAAAFAAQLAGWMDANPPKLGLNWASSLEVALRSISWLWSLQFFRDSASLSPELFARALKFLRVHASHLETYLSTYFAPNTHLTGEALGLFYLGTLLAEFKDSARWRATGRRVLLEQLARQVRPDGVYFEQSTYYQRYTADIYTHFLLLARAGESAPPKGKDAGLSTVEEKLLALLDHLMWITRPDGTSPYFGDDDGGRLLPLDERAADDFRQTLAVGAAIFERADYKFVAGEAGESVLWLLGPRALGRSDAITASPPAALARAFTDGGYYVMRDGWTSDSNYFVIDCGPHGAHALNHGHAHADALSFELAANGRALVVDPGTYTYTGDPRARDEFRSSLVHNAPVVAGASSSVPAREPFRWQHVARARQRAWVSHARCDYFEGEHDGYRRLTPPAAVSRGVLFLRGDYWIVRDRVTRPTGVRQACELRLQLAPGVAASFDAEANALTLSPPEAARAESGQPSSGKSFAEESSGKSVAEKLSSEGRAGGGLELFCFGAGGAWRVERAWVSRCYGA
ncbi:MAG TPA: alginate lyase family protein, partial [Pyrinomonadaceae bacterium]|nr:alginate lyase family protein [Pyrinomonadaceae bacterium]